MVEYDEKILRAFANKLYLRANIIVFLYAVIVGVVGASIGIIVALLLNDTLYHALTGGFFGVILGSVMGQLKAFMLRLQAQQILCQAQIEKNTRKK